MQIWHLHEVQDRSFGGGPEGQRLCLVSNVLVYCTDEPSADVFAHLLSTGVKAVLLNERGGEQKMCNMVEKRGVVVAKLLDQTSAAGRDDRQLLWLPEGSPPPPPAPRVEHVFTNVPYEENKSGGAHDDDADGW